jgi:hypothetical protein
MAGQSDRFAYLQSHGNGRRSARNGLYLPAGKRSFSELGGVAASPEAATASALKDKLVNEISRLKPVIEAAGSIIE